MPFSRLKMVVCMRVLLFFISSQLDEISMAGPLTPSCLTSRMQTLFVCVFPHSVLPFLCGMTWHWSTLQISSHKPVHVSIVLKRHFWFCPLGCHLLWRAKLSWIWLMSPAVDLLPRLPSCLLDLPCIWEPFLIYFGSGLQTSFNFF